LERHTAGGKRVSGSLVHIEGERAGLSSSQNAISAATYCDTSPEDCAGWPDVRVSPRPGRLRTWRPEGINSLPLPAEGGCRVPLYGHGCGGASRSVGVDRFLAISTLALALQVLTDGRMCACGDPSSVMVGWDWLSDPVETNPHSRSGQEGQQGPVAACSAAIRCAA
jgi:hypothetical protein